jgi:hypothetical protein
MPLLWPNGLDLKKATLSRGRRQSTDFTPDIELIEALWGWNGETGCFLGYIPAERPVVGRESYTKLLPWQQHCDMMQAIVRSGLPVIVYGVIIGFPDDSHESLRRLEEAILELHPIPGTIQGEKIRSSGLLRFNDTSITGGFWTPSCDTQHLSYEEVSDWQIRLAKIGKKISGSIINYHGGLTGLASQTS